MVTGAQNSTFWKFKVAADAILDLGHVSVVSEDICVKFGLKIDIAIRESLGPEFTFVVGFKQWHFV